jgi:glycine oxidase
MIAPAFEAALDEAVHGRFDLLRAGRDLWLAGPAAGVLQRLGAMAVATPVTSGFLDRAEAELRSAGARHERLSGGAARERCPVLGPGATEAIYSPEDWLIDAPAGLEALETEFVRSGGERRRGRVSDPAEFAAEANAVVICAGWESHRFVSEAPELACMSPIKGQLVRFSGPPSFNGPVLRRPDLYLVPAAGGALAGASMEAGRQDLEPSPEVTGSIAEAAAELLPLLRKAEREAQVGVRAATPDGLPLVGRSSSGLMVATGFRRNGWTLAPLAARITADLLEGRDPGPWAHAMRPDRFA